MRRADCTAMSGWSPRGDILYISALHQCPSGVPGRDLQRDSSPGMPCPTQPGAARRGAAGIIPVKKKQTGMQQQVRCGKLPHGAAAVLYLRSYTVQYRRAITGRMPQAIEHCIKQTVISLPATFSLPNFIKPEIR